MMKVLLQKKRAKERIREFDANRKKFKDTSEAREEIFKRTKYEEKRKKVCNQFL